VCEQFAIDNLVALRVAGPTGEIDAIEERYEAGLGLGWDCFRTGSSAQHACNSRGKKPHELTLPLSVASISMLVPALRGNRSACYFPSGASIRPKWRPIQ